MKVVKAKYYEATNELIPLDPQPSIRVNGRLQYDRTGTDDKGDFVVIDFISEEATYLEYTAKDGGGDAFDLKITTEEEWLQPATLNTENMDLLLSEDALTVDANTSEKLATTNTEMNQVTSLTGIAKLKATIARLFFSAYDAIISIFR
jgi:hypothetical protein